MGIFFAGVEFFAVVDVLAACVATHRERSHETDRLLPSAFAAFGADELAWIKVRGVVFAEYFSFRHDSRRTLSGPICVERSINRWTELGNYLLKPGH